MDITYFPFTYMQKDSADIILKFFDKIIIYQPFSHSVTDNMQKLINENKIILRAPFKDDKFQILKMIEEYKSSYFFDNKKDIDFIKLKKKSFVYNENSAFALKDIIKKDKKDIVENDNFFFIFFLFLTYQFDKENSEIERAIDGLNFKKQEMFKKLKGGNFYNKNFDKILNIKDRGNFKLNERLKSWSYIYFNYNYKDTHFITDSRSVLENVLDKNNFLKVTSIDENVFEVYKTKNNMFNKYVSKEHYKDDKKQDNLFLFFLKERLDTPYNNI